MNNIPKGREMLQSQEGPSTFEVDQQSQKEWEELKAWRNN